MGRRRIRWQSKNKRWALVIAVAVCLACIALFVKAYNDAGTGSAAGPNQLGTDTAAEPSPSATRSASAAASAGRPDLIVPHILPRMTITPQVPGGFTFAPIPSRTVVLTVTSTVPIGRLGYVIPTSRDRSYGDIRGVGEHWTITTKVYGKPYYAALFIAAGTVPVTCAISVDGVVMSRETAQGNTRQQVCVA